VFGCILGEDIILTLTTTRVSDGRTASFSDRGHTVNLIHGLAEKVAECLSGTAPALVSADGNRSIISLKDESPGSVALHSPLIDAEIYVDGEFFGYTNGDIYPGRNSGPVTHRMCFYFRYPFIEGISRSARSTVVDSRNPLR